MHFLLFDLHSLAHPIWHQSGDQADTNWTSRQIIDRIRALSHGQLHAAICTDSAKSWRKEKDPTYKANRPAREAALYHQIGLAIDTLKSDGFPVWLQDGYEADDVIASAVAKILAVDPEATVQVVTDDKDLAQLLVDPRVTLKTYRDGDVRDATWPSTKWGVTASQVLDFLTLVGDSSDNVKGADGIGPAKAQKLLAEHGTLANVYQALETGAFPNGIKKSLTEFRERWPMVRDLLSLRTDADLPIHEIATEREVPPVAEAHAAIGSGSDSSDTNEVDSGVIEPEDLPTTAVFKGAPPPVIDSHPVPVEFAMELQPRTGQEAMRLATHLHASRLFLSGYGNPEAVLSTIIAGRELGMPAMAALRAFHIIENKPTLSADAMAALVLRSGKAEYFECTERTATSATFATQRTGRPERTLTYTIEEAKAAWKKDQAAWDKSGWGRFPADMLVARCKSKLARLVYPDVVGGLYAAEEFE